MKMHEKEMIFSNKIVLTGCQMISKKKKEKNTNTPTASFILFLYLMDAGSR
jgi:hypothetical protein